MRKQPPPSTIRITNNYRRNSRWYAKLPSRNTVTGGEMGLAALYRERRGQEHSARYGAGGGVVSQGQPTKSKCHCASNPGIALTRWATAQQCGGVLILSLPPARERTPTRESTPPNCQLISKLTLSTLRCGGSRGLLEGRTSSLRRQLSFFKQRLHLNTNPCGRSCVRRLFSPGQPLARRRSPGQQRSFDATGEQQRQMASRQPPTRTSTARWEDGHEKESQAAQRQTKKQKGTLERPFWLFIMKKCVATGQAQLSHVRRAAWRKAGKLLRQTRAKQHQRGRLRGSRRNGNSEKSVEAIGRRSTFLGPMMLEQRGCIGTTCQHQRTEACGHSISRWFRYSKR